MRSSSFSRWNRFRVAGLVASSLVRSFVSLFDFMISFLGWERKDETAPVIEQIAAGALMSVSSSVDGARAAAQGVAGARASTVAGPDELRVRIVVRCGSDALLELLEAEPLPLRQ